MSQSKLIPNEIDDPIYLSKFPNAHVENDGRDASFKYENMIFESPFNDYISIIRGPKKKNKNFDLVDISDNFELKNLFGEQNEYYEYNLESNYKYHK